MQKKIKNKRKKLVKIVNETKENIISQQLQADDKNIFSHFNVTNLKTFDPTRSTPIVRPQSFDPIRSTTTLNNTPNT